MKIVTIISFVLNIALIAFIIIEKFVEPKINTEKERTFYAIGADLGKALERFNLADNELKLVVLGLRHRALRQPLKTNPNESVTQLQELTLQRATDSAQNETEESKQFLLSVEKQTEIIKTKSGLLYKITNPGKGKSPNPSEVVSVHYEGKLRNGQVFDSSLAKGKPISFASNRVIPCWQEALQLLKPGGKITIYCPSNLAYGVNGAPPTIPGGAALVFDIEFIGVDKAQK